MDDDLHSGDPRWHALRHDHLLFGRVGRGELWEADDAIETAYEPGLAVLRVDLFQVTFIDSTGMGCLIHGALQSTKLGVRFEVVPGRATLDLMRTTGLGTHLQVVPANSA